MQLEDGFFTIFSKIARLAQLTRYLTGRGLYSFRTEEKLSKISISH